MTRGPYIAPLYQHNEIRSLPAFAQRPRNCSNTLRGNDPVNTIPTPLQMPKELSGPSTSTSEFATCSAATAFEKLDVESSAHSKERRLRPTGGV
jgi:hypothetical protein